MNDKNDLYGKCVKLDKHIEIDHKANALARGMSEEDAQELADTMGIFKEFLQAITEKENGR